MQEKSNHAIPKEKGQGSFGMESGGSFFRSGRNSKMRFLRISYFLLDGFAEMFMPAQGAASCARRIGSRPKLGDEDNSSLPGMDISASPFRTMRRFAPF
jgi:hypothetical protein